MAAALQWQGDVLADGKIEWVQERKADQLTRALLGDCQDVVFWQPAFEKFLDRVATHESQSRRVAVLRGYGIRDFVPRTRASATRTYSMASKGIHHEFVLPLSSYYDVDTLQDLIDSAIDVAADLGVVTNCCEHIPFRIDPEQALSIYEAIQ